MIAIIANLQLIVDNCFDCADIVAASLLVWQGYQYEIMFINSWGFAFQPARSGRISDGLDERSGGILQPLELYLGIKTGIQKMAPDEAWDFVIAELRKERPVVLNVDLFDCPWHEHYQKNHRSHSVIILGNDERNGTLDCLDKYTLQAFNGPYKMTYQDFAGACQSLTIFSYIKPVVAIDWRVMVGEAVWCMKAKVDYDWYFGLKKAQPNSGLTWNFNSAQVNCGTINCFEEIRRFAGEVKRSGLPGELDVKQNPLIIRLMTLANGRRKFAYSLRYLGQKQNVEPLVDLARLMEHCSWQWNHAIKHLYNFLKTSDINEKNQFCEEVRSLAVFEEMLAEKLMELTVK